MIRIVIADDDTLVRDGLKIIIDSEDDMEVVGLAKDGSQASLLYQELKPDVVLMDIRMPGTDGIHGTRMIKGSDPNAKVLMLTTFKDDEYIASAVKMGAKGYMLKNQSSDEIIGSIRLVCSGASIYGEEAATKLKDMIEEKKEKADVSSLDLSERELNVLRLIAQGLSNKEIAAEMYISDGTVRNYVSVLLDKLNQRDRTQLAIYYIRNIE